MRKFVIRDTALLSGWLFADLLLGLMVIFLVSIPGIPPSIPTLAVTPISLNPTSSNCQPQQALYRCTVTVKETADSTGSVAWTSSTDMSPTVLFSPSTGTLSPNKSVIVTISSIPCQTGSFTFHGSRKAQPVTVAWNCVLAPVNLDLHFQEIHLTLTDVNAYLNNNPGVIANVQQQATQKIGAFNKRVGLIVVYGGAPTTDDISQAQAISQQTYSVLLALGQQGFSALANAVQYKPLYNLGVSPNDIAVDVFLFNR